LPYFISIKMIKEMTMFPREKEFIELLDKNKRPWIYQARRFKLSKTTYTPDFYLPEEDLYIEVVGTSQAYRANKEKIAEFKKYILKLSLLFWIIKVML